jgi:hypothetical protein
MSVVEESLDEEPPIEPPVEESLFLPAEEPPPLVGLLPPVGF